MLEPAERATGFSSRKAREAGGSIKPGAPAPGSRTNKYFGAREAGDSLKCLTLSPASRAHAPFNNLILGLAPQALCCHLLRRFKRSGAEPLAVLRREEEAKDHVPGVARIRVYRVEPVLESNRVRVAAQVTKVLHRHQRPIEELIPNRLA